MGLAAGKIQRPGAGHRCPEPGRQTFKRQNVRDPAPLRAGSRSRKSRL